MLRADLAHIEQAALAAARHTGVPADTIAAVAASGTAHAEAAGAVTRTAEEPTTMAKTSPALAAWTELNEVGGPPQHLAPFYIKEDSRGYTQYDVRFDGYAWAEGPTGYAIRGTLTADGGSGAATTQHATFGYKSSSAGWQYKTVACDDTPTEFTVRGQRKSGENIVVLVGATSGVLNVYQHGSEVSCALPTDF